jgi:putative flavoprotein involved in K+ transport
LIVERHEAVVIGAGPAGLAAAAMLSKHGFETLLLERTDAVGARWRTRYEGLRLNSMRIFSTLPGHRLPRRYGRYPSRDDFVTYLQAYASHHGLTVRYQTELKRIDRIEDEADWRLTTSTGTMLARYAIVATGYDAVPKMPPWALKEDFTGQLIHSSECRVPTLYRDREVLVVGGGNSGIDLAGHLVESGARVSVSMRTPPNVLAREWHGIPLQPGGFATEHLPARFGDTIGFLLQRLIHGNLASYGIPRAPEGFVTTYRRRHVNPAIDAGFIAALKAGRTCVVKPVERLEGSNVVLIDGTRLQPHVIVCATGYERGLEAVAGHLGVLRSDGVPVHFHARPEHDAAPRLYFAGFDGAPTGQIRTMPKHARRIVRSAIKSRTQMRRSHRATSP